MKRISTLLAGAVLSLSTLPSISAQDFEQMSAAVRATEGHSASFTHRFRPHGTDREIVETGTVIFGVLPQMRWSYRSPEEKVFVFDGTTSWLYIPADRQVSVHRLTEGERAQLPFLLLKDEVGAKKNFRIESSNREGTVLLSLKPKQGAQIRSLVLSIDAGSNRIHALEYEDLEGNHTRFEFARYRKGSAERGQFRFEAPAGVEMVEY